MGLVWLPTAAWKLWVKWYLTSGHPVYILWDRQYSTDVTSDMIQFYGNLLLQQGSECRKLSEIIPTLHLCKDWQSISMTILIQISTWFNCHCLVKRWHSGSALCIASEVNLVVPHQYVWLQTHMSSHRQLFDGKKCTAVAVKINYYKPALCKRYDYFLPFPTYTHQCHPCHRQLRQETIETPHNYTDTRLVVFICLHCAAWSILRLDVSPIGNAWLSCSG